MTEKIIPDGYKLVAVKGLDELVYWLERCKDKGHLENCADLIEPFEAFEYRNVSEEAVIAAHEAKAAPAVLQGERVLIDREQAESWLSSMERVIDVADRKTDEFDALRKSIIDLTLLLHATPSRHAAHQDMRMVPLSLLQELESSMHALGQGLDFTSVDSDRYSRLREAIAATPAAPSQPAVPQGEPVLVQHRKPIVGKDGETIGYTSWIDGNGLDWWPHRSLYATQSQPSKYGSPELQALIVTHATKSQPVTLTDEELEECFRRAHEETNTAYVPIARFPIGWRLYGRQVIAALREKEQAT